MLSVRDLSVVFTDRGAPFTAVDRFCLDMDRGEVVGIVGESGSGKSMTAHALMGLIRRSQVTVSGSAVFEGTDLLSLSREELRQYQGRDLSIIFQEPMTSLNPTMRIGKQVEESLRIHEKLSRTERKARALDAMALAGLPDPESVYPQYPHQLSGGMRQRVMIASALVLRPRLLIADEPTTALDVTIQAQILDLLRHLKDKINSSIMLITHDLGVIAEMADYVVVMYAGRVVEKGTVREIFTNPCHPYTIGLMASKPVVGKQVDRLYSIPGKVPNPVNMPDYCYYKDRCEMCVESCAGEYPGEISLSETHKVSCYRFYDGKGEK